MHTRWAVGLNRILPIGSQWQTKWEDGSRKAGARVTIAEKLLAYHGIRGEHDRECSWEYCYRHFHKAKAEAISADRNCAALQLSSYLASWGMYRNSFLLQHAYTVQLGVVDCLLQSKFSALWDQEFGASANDTDLVPLILGVYQEVRTAYSPFGKATDTLVTKVLLGTIGCFPALDKYFNDGYRHHSGFNVPDPLNPAFIEGVLRFCQKYLDDFQDEQVRIEQKYKMHYPLMKLVDMYFHQIGLELAKDDLKQRLTRYKRIKISAIGTTSGQTISISVRFVLEGEKVYLLPVKGSGTQWYKNMIQNPLIRIDARGAEEEFRGVPITEVKAVKSVIENFREKYGAKDVKKYYSKFDVAVVSELS